MPAITKKMEPILEYCADNPDVTTMVIDYCGNIYLGSEKDMWILPGKTYFVPTGIKCWYPNDAIGLTTNGPCTVGIDVIPQIHSDDCEIFLKVKNSRLLPRKIYAGDMLAIMTIIPKLECHIVHTKGQS